MNPNFVHIPLESFSYEDQSDISKTPEEWIDDERCIICKYSKRSFPQLCHCHENLIAGNNYSDKRKIGVTSKVENVQPPIPPVRTNSLTRGKKKKVSDSSGHYDYSLPNRHLRHSRTREQNGIPHKLSAEFGFESNPNVDDSNGLNLQETSSNRKRSSGRRNRASSKSSVESRTSFATQISVPDATNSFFQRKPSESEISVPSIIRNSKWNSDNWTKGRFTTNIDPECLTLYDVFRRGQKKSNGGICFGWRVSRTHPYQWISYQGALERSLNFGSGLIKMGLAPNSSSLVGIFSRNCLEWAIAEQALYSYSMVLVPLYDQLSAEALSYILRETNMKVIICDEDEVVNKILDLAPACLKLIVATNYSNPKFVKKYKTKKIISTQIKDATLNRAESMGIHIVKFGDIERFGMFGTNGDEMEPDDKTHRVKETPPEPHSPAIICFTQIDSSSNAMTGKPKGVILSHENIVACTSACAKQLGVNSPNKNDIMISYLPMAHMLERICQVSILMVGGAIGFYSGDVNWLTEDMKLLQPTFVPTVPKFFNRLYNRVVTRLSRHNLTRHIFNLGLKKKSKEMTVGLVRSDSIWDHLLFRKFVKESAGLSRVRLMIVGSAPLCGNTLTFMRATLGCVIVEGYGQTECTAACTLTVQGDSTPDHVGPPLPCCVLKLIDVPDMEYFAARNQGEICVRGSNVFLGYFKDPEKTRSVIDDDGWLHTGDIGQWLPNGTMKIIDRKQLNILKLAQGEYVDCEKIENLYLQSQYIAQAFVHGNSLKSSVVAIIVPEIEVIKEYAAARKIPNKSFSFMCRHLQIKNLLQTEVDKISRQENLKDFETAKTTYLHQDLFSYQNGLLNCNEGKNRKKLEQYFKPQIEDLYSKIP